MYLFLALVGGAIGTGAFIYGKKTQKLKPLVVGILLMGLSYLVTSPLWLGLATAGLTALLFTDTTQLIYRLTSGRDTRNIQSIE
jgi:hypothetical protein